MCYAIFQQEMRLKYDYEPTDIMSSVSLTPNLYMLI